VLAAGCASEDRRQARFDETLYPGTPVLAGGSTAPVDVGEDRVQSDVHSSGYTSSPSSAYSSDVFSTNPADNSLVTSVRQAITNDTTLAPVASAIQIGASDGSVTLFGRVQSDDQKQRVEELVRQTSGVGSVNNQIQVSSAVAATTPGTSEDAALTATSRLGDGASSQDSIQGESRMTQQGEMAASGTASSPMGQTESGSELTATSRTNSASSIYGQTDTSATVSNQVDSTSEQLDQTSAENAAMRIYSGTNQMSDAGSSEGELSPTASGGASSQQYSSGQTGGVNVQVQGTSQTDRTLAQQISQELRSDASLASAITQVSISVNDGQVTLRGSVRSEVQKREIEAAIQRATGVSSIDNQLRVGSGDESMPHTP
jgi:osmotically-inducible protein OsmY